jgi:hypothetical protein
MSCIHCERSIEIYRLYKPVSEKYIFECMVLNPDFITNTKTDLSKEKVLEIIESQLDNIANITIKLKPPSVPPIEI